GRNDHATSHRVCTAVRTVVASSPQNADAVWIAARVRVSNPRMVVIMMSSGFRWAGRPALVCLSVMTTLLLAVVPAAAQTDAGAVRELVTDASGGVVPGATVDLVSVATNDRRTAVTDVSGYVQFTPIARGTYGVTVTLSGFSTVE